MEDKFRNKYRVSSARLSTWDYGADGMYFVTICTKERMRYFGEIELNAAGQTQNLLETEGIASLRMTEVGKVAYDNFEKISLFHPYVEVDEFVIMPDHIHGILFINKPDKTTWELNKFGSQKITLPR